MAIQTKTITPKQIDRDLYARQDIAFYIDKSFIKVLYAEFYGDAVAYSVERNHFTKESFTDLQKAIDRYNELDR